MDSLGFLFRLLSKTFFLAAFSLAIVDFAQDFLKSTERLLTDGIDDQNRSAICAGISATKVRQLVRSLALVVDAIMNRRTKPF